MPHMDPICVGFSQDKINISFVSAPLKVELAQLAWKEGYTIKIN